MNKNIITILAIALLLIVGCASQSIKDIKKDDMVGKTVAVSGTVEGVIKIGQLSGYTLVDANGDKIGVSSEALPKDGSKITVSGTLMKDTLLGFYIKVV
jgi:ABC-type Fe3+-hydroxamate transport system substrate-binding protein